MALLGLVSLATGHVWGQSGLSIRTGLDILPVFPFRGFSRTMLRRLLVLCGLLAPFLAPLQAESQTLPEACVEALAAEGNRWDGIPMDVFVWDGSVLTLGDIDVSPISICRAAGPLEILPPSQLIGCVLVDTQVGRVGGDLACGAFQEIRIVDDSILWVARSNAASNEVTRLTWNGMGFDRGANYVACWDDPMTPITDLVDCGR
jgi:hypothetical protein